MRPKANTALPSSNIKSFRAGFVPFVHARTVKAPRSVHASAGKLDEVPLFGTVSLSGPSPTSTTSKPSTVDLDTVALESEVGMDYTALKEHLKEKDFRKADDETRALLIKLAGEGAVQRNWVYFSEVKSISVKDLRTLDNLWKTASNGKFGYSVQKEIWIQNSKRWGKFFKQIDWTQGENNNYRKWPMEFTYSMDAVKGHLPLTNALRGTQLFEAIMEHPAFERAQKQSIDDKVSGAAKATLKWPSI